MRAHFRLRTGPSGRRRLVAAGVAFALLLHGVVTVLFVWLDPVWRVPSREIVEITFVKPEDLFPAEDLTTPSPAATPAAAEATVLSGEDLGEPTGTTPASEEGPQAPATAPGEVNVARAARDHMAANVRDRLRRPPTSDRQARDLEKIVTATDTLDGVGRLGSGRPGDPRIPGSGGVPIGKVVRRDATVVTSRLRADEGVIHPFVAQLKREIEKGWKPKHADVRALRDPTPVADPVCAKGQHDRYLVARVFAIYDADGNPLDLHIDGATIARNIRTRIESAVRVLDLRGEIPDELLNEKDVLRLAWNVYLDDYTGCGLVGKGASGTARGFAYVVGVVELDGVY